MKVSCKLSPHPQHFPNKASDSFPYTLLEGGIKAYLNFTPSFKIRHSVPPSPFPPPSIFVNRDLGTVFPFFGGGGGRPARYRMPTVAVVEKVERAKGPPDPNSPFTQYNQTETCLPSFFLRKKIQRKIKKNLDFL